MLFHALIEKLHGPDVQYVARAGNGWEIDDLALLDGESAEYLPQSLYFGYYTQTGAANPVPPQCILAHTEIPPLDFARGISGNLAAI